MADRGYIPSSPACGQWEMLLAEALDGQLPPEDEAEFTGHMALCPSCAALFEDARQGREWLAFLAPEPEIPEGLMDRILAHTGPGHEPHRGLATAGAGAAAMPPPWQRSGFTGQVRRYAEPRLLMTIAMAFFSIALTLNLTGVQLNHLRLSELRPSAIKAFMTRRIVTASIPIIRYYDHLRFMYDVESSMRQTRGNPVGESENQPQAQPSAPGRSKQGSSGDGGSRANPPQQSGNHDGGSSTTAPGDYLESSLERSMDRAAHSGGSATRTGERSTVWTA